MTDRSMNQDLQVLTALMKDYLTLNMLMIDLETEDATKLQLVHIFTSVADINYSFTSQMVHTYNTTWKPLCNLFMSLYKK